MILTLLAAKSRNNQFGSLRQMRFRCSDIVRHVFSLAVIAVQIIPLAATAHAEKNANCSIVYDIISVRGWLPTFGDPCKDVFAYTTNVRVDSDGDEDQQYTGGLFIDTTYTGNTTHLGRAAIGHSFSFMAFTATEITERDPEIGDRPYASLFTAGVFAQTKPYRHSFLRYQIDVGLLGILGEAIQTTIHDTYAEGARTPQGWRHQVAPNLGINFTLEFLPYTLVIIENWPGMSVLDLAPYGLARYGTIFRDVEFGLIGRINFFGGMEPYSNSTTASLFPALAMGSPEISDKRLSVFISYGKRFVDFNATLEGGQGISFGSGDSSNERLVKPASEVEQTEYGINYSWAGTSVDVSLIEQSSEQKDSSIVGDTQRFRQLNMAFTERF